LRKTHKTEFHSIALLFEYKTSRLIFEG